MSAIMLFITTVTTREHDPHSLKQEDFWSIKPMLDIWPWGYMMDKDIYVTTNGEMH